LFLTLAHAQFHSRWDTAPMAHDKLPEPVIRHTPLNHKNTGLNVTGNVLRVTNPRKFFHVFPPIKGCPSFSHTTDNAKDHDCVLATNGGFFNTHTGGCIGNLVSEGKVISVGEDCKANFGTINGNFVVGYINHTTLKANKFDNLVAGTVFNDMIALV
jgi:exopolysaccharide biosynthesis protein